MGPSCLKKRCWQGCIRFVDAKRLEFEVKARGSTFHMILGRHAYGRYVCIPNRGIGTEISSLDDRFWNMERITEIYPDLSLVDAVSIVDALSELSNYVSL
jgi:hypothetical protein